LAKIIKFDSSRKRPEALRKEKIPDCDHKQVIAYTFYRVVRCAVCGAELDAFDVLVDMLKSYIPPAAQDREEKRLAGELEKRSRKKSPKNKPSRE